VNLTREIQQELQHHDLKHLAMECLLLSLPIMVLELKPPHGTDWAALKPSLPGLISYVMSFLFVGVYWGNHHHLVHVVKRLSTGIMLSNLHLLFWLSLVPFVTGWVAENNFAPLPVAVYAALLDICGVAYTILQKMIEACHPDNIALKEIMKNHTRKGLVSLIGYTSAIPLAYVNPYISVTIFFAIAIWWLIPDRNILKANE
jgi:uncharacterized membrane protein